MKRSRLALAAGALLIGLVAAGCPRTDIGQACAPAAAAVTPILGDGTTAIIDPGAPECQTGICLVPPAANSTDTGPLCSAECSSDSDCDGEGTRDSASPLCKTGFACRVITTVGQLCCRRFCACRDFIPPPELSMPAACMPGSGTACRNVR